MSLRWVGVFCRKFVWVGVITRIVVKRLRRFLGEFGFWVFVGLRLFYLYLFSVSFLGSGFWVEVVFEFLVFL